MERRFSRKRFGDRRFGNRGFGGGFEKPVKIGEEYDVEIKEVGSKGDGIARVKNFVIFVPNTKTGEKCKIKINQVSRKFAVGEKVGKADKVEGKTEETVEESIEQDEEEFIEEEPFDEEVEEVED